MIHNPADRAPLAAPLKHRVQSWLRKAHHRVLDRGLPRKVALYFHAMDEGEQKGLAHAVRFFRGEGYKTVASPEAFLSAKGRVLWVSFDDNYRAWYEARPLLDDLQVRGTFYTNTGAFRDLATEAEIDAYYDRLEFTGPRVPLTTDELLALHTDGHVIAAHTHTHPNLGSVGEAQAAGEIRVGVERLEDLLGKAVNDFSYPYGMRRNFPDSLAEACADAGVETIARAIPAMLHAPQGRRTAAGPREIHRHGWRAERTPYQNIRDLCADGRAFERVTGRSAVG